MRRLLLLVPLLCALPSRADFTSLNMGLDYHLRGVSTKNPDTSPQTSDGLGYYSQSARLYMTAWLNEDVEAAFRLRSLDVWGMEGAGAPLTRYPAADGTPWVEEAYVHMPNVAWKRVDLTIGRQPITLGDGMLVSSDGLGFNALRAKIRGPWKTELDLFTAKTAETLSAASDGDLRAAVLRTRQEERHWDIGWVQESSGGGLYQLAGSTRTATHVIRRFYDLRLFGDLKDAYYKLEVALQKGDARLLPGETIHLDGIGQRLELGAQKDTEKLGRFGVKAVYAEGSGDDPNSADTDEGFRPTFAHRWDGLEREGYGAHYAATLSDAYDASAPFAAGTTGLPAGASGIRTLGLGIFSTQKVFWTGALDYYIYEARTKPAGLGDLGSEMDAQVTYRYTGFVTFRLGASLFFPGNAYGADASRVTRTFFETHVHF